MSGFDAVTACEYARLVAQGMMKTLPSLVRKSVGVEAKDVTARHAGKSFTYERTDSEDGVNRKSMFKGTATKAGK